MTWQMGFSSSTMRTVLATGECQDHARFSGLGVAGIFSVVLIHDGLGEIKAHAGPVFFGGEIWREEFIAHLFWDSRAAVLDLKDDCFLRGMGLRRKLEGPS